MTLQDAPLPLGQGADISNEQDVDEHVNPNHDPARGYRPDERHDGKKHEADQDVAATQASLLALKPRQGT